MAAWPWTDHRRQRQGRGTSEAADAKYPRRGTGRETRIRAMEVAFSSWVYFTFRANRIVWPTGCGGKQVERSGVIPRILEKSILFQEWTCSLEEEMWRETKGGQGWDWVILPPMELKLMHWLWPTAFRILYFNGKIKTHRISQLITSDISELTPTSEH